MPIKPSLKAQREDVLAKHYKPDDIVSRVFKYQRLPTFFFERGKIGHPTSGCGILCFSDGEYDDDGDDDAEPRYRDWLRASPFKQCKVIMDAAGRGVKEKPAINDKYFTLSSSQPV
ncbi:unnamed protein product [Dovyalis caffra]|uniref:Uncharacterized protein n=1 Tax=Dovyalis caffra TaxID=77055 RepID=A0AAV1SW98_9ROSI|nr:unnamed protein product [Dovyalis caffra]